MRSTKLTATLFATTMIISLVGMPEGTYGVEGVARRLQAQQEAQRAKDAAASAAAAAAQAHAHAGVVAGHMAAHAAVAGAFMDPLTILTTPAAAGNMMQALTDAVGNGSVVTGNPIATTQEKLTVIHNIEAAVIMGAHNDTIKAKEDIRKVLGLTHDAAALQPGSAQSLTIAKFIDQARILHILNLIGTKLIAANAPHIRQHVRGAGGDFGVGGLTAQSTPTEILKAFAQAMNLTVQDAIGNGLNPNIGEVGAWLAAEFDVP